ncbi:hypothetical protein C1M56_00820 [Vibrio diazotrophicus]|nr:hypothetical protein C1M56_00820 [Vibrio diazotrophicus]
MLEQSVKLVIWDLDETFWKGTLSEEGIEVLEENVQFVKELTARGIVNTISSKNDFEQAKEKLIEIGIWDYFVFPKISWDPKGIAVKNTLEEMGLRAANSLFIDDNHMNRNEVSSFCEGITCVHPDCIEMLKDSTYLKGKDDSNHSRLEQYKVLEKKVSTKISSGLSNVEFLRDCGIKIRFEYDVLGNIDRVFELIERTNQLNYTKKRFLTQEEKDKFISSLEHYQNSSALIYAKDNYGDYGAVGFYQLETTFKQKAFIHFLFSCRTMNMGIESYVYDYLGRPKISISEPVAYQINHYKDVDWVSVVESFDTFNGESVNYSHILALGPCTLLQMSNFLKGSKEYFHYVNASGVMVKYDCPGFFINDPDLVNKSNYLEQGNSWSKESFFQFRNDLKLAKRVVLDLADLLSDYKIIKVDGLILRKTNQCFDNSEDLNINEKVNLLKKSIEFVLNNISENSEVILLDRVIDEESLNLKEVKLAYKYFINVFSSYDNRIKIIDLNKFYDADLYGDSDGHLNRSGYLGLARAVGGYDAVDDHFSLDIDYNVFINKNKITLNNIDNIRDVAFVLEDYDRIDLAEKLLSAAHQVRPSGKVIKSKLDEYQIKLQDESYILERKLRANTLNEHVDDFRDTALMLGEAGNIDIAAKLMRAAHLLRPSGVHIKSKLDEYQIKLQDESYILEQKLRANTLNEQVDEIRDVALMLEEEGRIDVAAKLMESAHLIRPSGVFIKKKLDEYRCKLQQQTYVEKKVNKLSILKKLLRFS